MLGYGIVDKQSRGQYVDIIQNLTPRDAQGII